MGGGYVVSGPKVGGYSSDQDPEKRMDGWVWGGGAEGGWVW